MDTTSTLFAISLAFGGVLIVIMIASVFFKTKEKVDLQKETNRLLQELLNKK